MSAGAEATRQDRSARISAVSGAKSRVGLAAIAAARSRAGRQQGGARRGEPAVQVGHEVQRLRGEDLVELPGPLAQDLDLTVHGNNLREAEK